MKMPFGKKMPLSQTWVTRVLLAVIVVLALVAGYFYTENQKLKEKIGNTPAETENSGLKMDKYGRGGIDKYGRTGAFN